MIDLRRWSVRRGDPVHTFEIYLGGRQVGGFPVSIMFLCHFLSSILMTPPFFLSFVSLLSFTISHFLSFLPLFPFVTSFHYFFTLMSLSCSSSFLYHFFPSRFFTSSFFLVSEQLLIRRELKSGKGVRLKKMRKTKKKETEL